MDREAAMRVEDVWQELVAGDDALRAASGDLRRALALLPQDTEAAAAAPVSGRPGIVAVAGDGFFVVTFERAAEDGDPRSVVERLALAPNPPTLAVREAWRGHEEAIAQLRARVSSRVRHGR